MICDLCRVGWLRADVVMVAGSKRLALVCNKCGGGRLIVRDTPPERDRRAAIAP